MSNETQTVSVTPWEVKGEIDYKKLTEQFGCDIIDGALIKRFEQATNVRAHTWLRRGLFFSNKDLKLVLDDYEAGRQIYLYTGRGPSSETMHLGHLVPFLFTRYLQDALDAVLVIQMSDDEKFYFKGGSEGKPVEHYNRLAYENAKDIIACGFDPNRTFIFSNFRTCGGALYQNSVRVLNSVTGTRIKAIYGLDLLNTNGQLCWPSFQCSPAYSSSFPDILHRDGTYSDEYPDGTRDYVGAQIRCLVPMAIDQDPYFRMARDFADKYKSKGYLKPATIHSKFLVGLGGVRAKMSSSGGEPSLFLSDDTAVINKKIMKHAYSGGQQTVEDHRRIGGVLDEDVAYQYLLYFCDDDDYLREIAHKYRSGEMLSGEIKKIMSKYVCEVIEHHQKSRAQITPELLRTFFSRDREFNTRKSEREPIVLHSNEVYSKYGVDFDRNFGAVKPRS